ncbi:MAG: hypothetical protein ACI9U0_001475 [Flavobacteriales bacterium]|jgi:hypothetical protein
MKIRLTIFLFGFMSISLVGQNEDKMDHTVGYHHIFYSGIQVNTHGWGFGFRRGYHQTVKRKLLYEFEFTTLKHAREVKLLPADGSNGFVFARENLAYNLRFGIGKHNVLAYKPFGEGVEIKTIYTLGLSTVLLKPVYYYMIYGDTPESSLERFDEEKHNVYNILSSGPYLKGFNELSIQPGIFGKFALNFEYAAERASIRSLEVGVVVDGYYKNVDLLAFADNYPVYVSFYLSLQYGGKWYR